MKLRLLKILLLLVILTPILYSSNFAGKDPVNVIIEEKIDELWTTGKLNIGQANIASKHWLPSLYERNDFQLLWQNPQNVTDLLDDIGR